MATGTKKVGGAAAAGSKGATTAAAAGKEKKEKKAGRSVFDLKTAVDAAGVSIKLNDDGQLTAVPANFDPKKHKPLKGKHLADDGVIAEYRAMVNDYKSAHYKALADQAREDAANFKKFGDPEKRKTVKKLEKTAEQLLSLQESIAADGGDVDVESLEALLAKIKAKRAEKAAQAAPATTEATTA